MTKASTNTDYDEDEISLLGVFRFFQRQWRVIGGVTIVSTVIISAISLTKPASYQRSVTLQVSNMPVLQTIFGTHTNFGRPEIANASQTGVWALRTLRKIELSSVSPTVKYDDTTKQLTLALVAADPERLDAITVSRILAEIAEQWQIPLQQAISERVRQLEVQQQQTEQSLSQLDAAIQQLSSGNLPRQQALEAQRASALLKQAELAFQVNYVAELENDLEQTSRELLPVVITTDGKAEKLPRPPLQTPIIAFIGGLLVAMVVASLVDQWQEELMAANNKVSLVNPQQ